MTSIAAVLLDAYFNRTSSEEARRGAVLAAEAAELRRHVTAPPS